VTKRAACFVEERARETNNIFLDATVFAELARVLK
jgi:hypothetical protein